MHHRRFECVSLNLVSGDCDDLRADVKSDCGRILHAGARQGLYVVFDEQKSQDQ